MNNIEQALHHITKHRYSIRQLLEIAVRSKVPFDLSRFSYEAARAGVVPQLSGCTMSSTVTATNGRRSISSQGMKSIEDAEGHAGTQGLQPVRSPVLPPTGLKAQEDQGFVRFLKKHSSPTHQRVTAGGRIVPMDPRPSPPTFSLNDGSRNLHRLQTSPQSLYLATSIQKATPTFNREPWSKSDQKKDTTWLGNYRPNELSTMSRGQGEFKSLNPGRHVSLVKETPQFSYQSPTFDGPSIEIASSVQAIEDVRGSSNGLRNHSTHTSSDAPTTIPIESLILPQVDNQYIGGNVISQQVVAAQQSLSYWSQCYHELDQQLKTLDRQRAMGSLNMDMVNQRKAIVQQRSDTKDIIKNISTYLSLSSRALSDLTYGPLNVNAAVYVPQSQHPTEDVPVIRSDGFQSQHDNLKDCIQPPGRRRPIPIIAPSTGKVTYYEQNREDDPSTKSEILDEWGVKIGAAPLELQRQQHATVVSMAEPAEVEYTPISRRDRFDGKTSFRSYSETDAYRFTSEDSSSDKECGLQSKQGRAPPQVEADYVKQLDALRKPQGVTTLVQLHDTSTIRVEGQNLCRPPVHTMSDFEKLYWCCDRPVEQPPKFSFNVESAQAMQRIKTQSSPSQSPSHSSQNETYFSMAELDKKNARELDNVNDMLKLSYSGHIINTTTQRAGHFDLQLQPRMPQPIVNCESKEERDGNLSSHTYSISPQLASITSIVDDGGWGEDVSNKGYSSISIQNVHARGHFPYVDGVNEQGRGTQSLLGVASRTKSPRVLQRGRVNHSAWFGPFRRGLGEPAGYHGMSTPSTSR